MTWPQIACTEWNNLGKQQVQFSCTFSYAPLSKLIGSCPDTRVEQNSWRRTSCNMQRRIHHSRDQQKKAPTSLSIALEKDRCQDGIAQTTEQNTSCWCKATDGNWFTTDAAKIVEVHMLSCPIVLLLQMDKCVIGELGNRSREAYIPKSDIQGEEVP